MHGVILEDGDIPMFSSYNIKIHGSTGLLPVVHLPNVLAK
jgi:hypothetical protein